MVIKYKRTTHSLTAMLCIAASLAPMIATADDVSNSESIDTLPTYLVVSTRTPLDLDRVSPSVDYVSKEVMEFWQDRSLVDSLTRVPGVVFWSNGTAGSLSSLSIRGSESNHTSFFLDGRRLNPGFGNQFYLESLNMDNLDSLQIQRGASSVNYGSSGIGGAVALESRSTLEDDGFSGSLEAEAGSNQHRHASVSTRYSEEKWGFSVGASALGTDNERANDDFERDSVQGRFDFQIAHAWTLEFIGHYAGAEKGNPGVITNPKADDRQWTTNWLLSPGLRYATDELSFHLFYARSESLIENDLADFFGSIYQTENRIESDEVHAQVDYSLSDEALLTFGAVYRNDRAYDPNLNAYSGFLPVLPYENRFEQTGLWTQLQWRWSDALELRAGLRYDTYSDYDDSLNGNLELIYHVSESTSLFAKLATSYAPPSALDLAFDEDQAIVDDGFGGEVIVPNVTTLNPEESVSYELGIRHDLLDDRMRLSAVLFRNEIDELITFISLQDENDPLDFFDDEFGSDTLNVEEATTEGIEFSVDYTPTEWIDLSLAYTYLTATNDSEGKRLAYRPRHQLQFDATYRANDALNLGINVLGQLDRERGRFQQPNMDVEDFVVVNLVAEWSVCENWTLFGRVGNLLDESYAPVFSYPALGRAGYLGARFEF